jgi:hypothetical protein
MRSFFWTGVYHDAIHETDPVRQNSLTGLAIHECTRRLLQVSLLPTCQERQHLYTALSDLRIILFLNRKYEITWKAKSEPDNQSRLLSELRPAASDHKVPSRRDALNQASSQGSL